MPGKTCTTLDALCLGAFTARGSELVEKHLSNPGEESSPGGLVATRPGRRISRCGDHQDVLDMFDGHNNNNRRNRHHLAAVDMAATRGAFLGGIGSQMATFCRHHQQWKLSQLAAGIPAWSAREA